MNTSGMDDSIWQMIRTNRGVLQMSGKRTPLPEKQNTIQD